MAVHSCIRGNFFFLHNTEEKISHEPDCRQEGARIKKHIS